MKYDLTARLFPLIFDRYAYALFRNEGLRFSKKKVRSAYRTMVERTPALPKDDPLAGNLLMGCYALSFYKAYPDLVTDEVVSKIVIFDRFKTYRFYMFKQL